MATTATGTFEINGWDEKPYAEMEGGRKLTRASVKQAFAGDIEGDGAVEWLMCYRDDGTANWCGLQRIDGQVGGRTGTFVLQMAGTFDGQVAKGDWFVVPGSATGDLRSLEGTGGMHAPLGQTPSFTLDYDVE
jgi:Protein of unknown function (DUF3224)